MSDQKGMKKNQNEELHTRAWCDASLSVNEEPVRPISLFFSFFSLNMKHIHNYLLDGQRHIQHDQ